MMGELQLGSIMGMGGMDRWQLAAIGQSVVKGEENLADKRLPGREGRDPGSLGPLIWGSEEEARLWARIDQLVSSSGNPRGDAGSVDAGSIVDEALFADESIDNIDEAIFVAAADVTFPKEAKHFAELVEAYAKAAGGRGDVEGGDAGKEAKRSKAPRSGP